MREMKSLERVPNVGDADRYMLTDTEGNVQSIIVSNAEKMCSPEDGTYLLARAIVRALRKPV